jgi:peroxiredoxin
MSASKSLYQDLDDARLRNNIGEEILFKNIRSDKITLIILLRHFGCIGCVEHVAEWVPRILEFSEQGVDMIFIGNGDSLYIDNFVSRSGLSDKPVRVFTDPSLEFHKKAGMPRALSGVFGFRSLKNISRAMLKGHFQTSIEGDSLQQGGIILFDKNHALRFIYREKALGDFIAPSVIMEEVLKIKTSQ